MATTLESLVSPAGRLILRVRGALDLSGVQAVELKLTAAAARAGRHVIVNLSEVDQIASLGMGMLVSVSTAVSGKGFRMMIVLPHSAVLDSMRRARLDQVLSIVPDQAAADAALDRA